MTGWPESSLSEICCPEWPSTGRLKAAAAGSAAGADPRTRPEPELASALPASWPTTPRAIRLVPGTAVPGLGQCPTASRCPGRCRRRKGWWSLGRGQQQLELAALTRVAADQDLAAVGPRDRAAQAPPQPGAPGMAAVTAPEPVENVLQLLVGNALAAVGDDHPDRKAEAGGDHRQLDDVAVTGVPYRVFEQCVDRQPEPLLVRLHGGLVQPAELPAAIGGGPPLAQDLHGKAVKRDRLGVQELGIF